MANYGPEETGFNRYVDRLCQCYCFTATTSSYRCVVEIKMKVKLQDSCGPEKEDPIYSQYPKRLILLLTLEKQNL